MKFTSTHFGYHNCQGAVARTNGDMGIPSTAHCTLIFKNTKTCSKAVAFLILWQHLKVPPKVSLNFVTCVYARSHLSSSQTVSFCLSCALSSSGENLISQIPYFIVNVFRLQNNPLAETSINIF